MHDNSKARLFARVALARTAIKIDGRLPRADGSSAALCGVGDGATAGRALLRAAVASVTPPPEAIAHTAAGTPTAESSGHAYCDARSPASSLLQKQCTYSLLLMVPGFVPIFVVKAAVSCARVSGTRIAAATHYLTFSILLVMLAASFLFSLEASCQNETSSCSPID